MAKKVIIVIFSALLSIMMLSGCINVRQTEADSTAVDTTEKITDTSDMVDKSTDTADTSDEVTTEEVTTEPETTAEVITEPVTTEAVTTAAPPAYTEPVSATGSMYPTILMYHLILDEPFTSLTSLFVKVNDFEAQVKMLSDAGYSFLFADEFGEVSTKSVILTIDDGYEDNYTNMFPILKKYNAKATVFMVSGYIGGEYYLNSEQIKEMAASGLVQFGSHTVSHQNLANLSEEDQRYQLADSKATLQALTGQEINSICYPTGGYNATTIALASEYYNFGYTTHRGKYSGENAFELPRIGVQRGLSADSLLWTLGG